MKTITIKLTKASSKMTTFTIKDQFGNIIASAVSKAAIIAGVSYSVDDGVTMVTISSNGNCQKVLTKNVSTINQLQLLNISYTETLTAYLWRHLTDVNAFNYFYGNIEPYVIEHLFSYKYQDEILQNVKDYTKAYQYLTNESRVFNYADKIEVDDLYFNKAVVYNGQQSSGVLNLVTKPLHNMRAYMSYPIYGTDSKTITFTKSDNFYQYNNFWNVVKDKRVPLFITSCESLSIDKVVNQDNMDYSIRSFNKETLRAKDLRVRHCLDNRSDVHLVSQFLVTPSQISHK